MAEVPFESTVTAPKLFDLSGKIAMVTAGTHNLGEEIASGLAEAGAQVIITSRDPARARSAAERMEKTYGHPFVPMSMELSSESSVAALFAEVAERFGRLDILVNNAGYNNDRQNGKPPWGCGWLEKETIEGWNAFISSNLTGTFLMLREYARFMKGKGSGSVINIASMAGVIGRDRRIYRDDMTPQPVPYAAAKAGIIGMTKDVAAYLGPHGIRVNSVSPGGFLRTQPEHFVKDYSDLTMLRRMGTPGHDLKGVVLFLASDASAYITGQNLLVDGGFTACK